jgi:hypothetical protein
LPALLAAALLAALARLLLLLAWLLPAAALLAALTGLLLLLAWLVLAAALLATLIRICHDVPSFLWLEGRNDNDRLPMLVPVVHSRCRVKFFRATVDLPQSDANAAR